MTQTATRPAVPGLRRPVLPARTGFRPDIEGLRAVAVLLVVLGHAGVPGFAGGYVGVDVFFVISGFLITTLLVKEAARTGRVSIAGFYARRAVRLLPAAAVVLMVTVAATWLWLTPVRVREFALDALASAFYASNIRFAVTGTEYLNADAGPSPLQHFWSLAVEEQFYLFWPLLIIFGGWAAARSALSRTRWTVAALGLLTAVSFWLSVTETVRSAPWAYFGAHTRAWELGVGAMIALGAARLARLSGPLAAILGWLGVAAILGAALGFDETTAYPGSAAALPVLGAALVVVSGINQPRHGVPALLGDRRLQVIGRHSYSWYLWHWPVLMIGPAALGVQAGLATNLLLCAGAFGLAALTYRFVENPIRHRRTLRDEPVRGLKLGLALSCLVGLTAVAAAVRPPQVETTGQQAPDLAAALAGAADPARVLSEFIARGADAVALPSNLTPSLTEAGTDKPQVYDDACHLEAEPVDVLTRCVYGDRTATTTMVLFGDSHAAQWFPALDVLAQQRRWKIVSLTKSSCPAADVLVWHTSLKRGYTECETWRDAALKEIAGLRPAVVVVASSFNYEPAAKADPGTQWTAGWTRTHDALRRTGARVVTIADTPYMSTRVPACLAQRAERISRCNRTRSSVLRGPEQRAALTAVVGKSGATLIDPLPWLCADVCPAVIGNVLVYRDSNHLSTAYTRAVLPLLARAIPA